MPTGALVLVIIVVAAAPALLVARTRSDLRRRYERTGSVSLTGWSGSPAISVDLELPRQEARRLACAAVRTTAECDQVVDTDEVIVGWQQVPLLGLGWAPQQVAVQIVPLGENRTRLVCFSRPRFAIALSDGGRSRRVVNSLAAFVRTT